MHRPSLPATPFNLHREANMKGSSCLFLFFLFLFLSSASARLLTSKQDEKDVKNHEITQAISSFTEINKEDVSNLMGLEKYECNDEDEECLKRRMVAEAHLDYIYTQHHNKP